MIVQKNRNKLFNSRLKKINTFFNTRSYNNWLKKTFIRIVVVSILLVIILTIKTLNFEGPKQVLNFVESKLQSDANIELYLTQVKRLTSYVHTFSNKAIEAIKIEDKLNKSFVLPVNGEITTYFNEYMDETSNISKGLIFTSYMGESIYSIDEGVIIDIGSNKSIGNYIIIKHRGELLSVYKYVGNSYVQINDIVKQGQTIGTSSEKLLLEVWYRNEPIDPMQYISNSTQQL